jgi:hypothetical protein
MVLKSCFYFKFSKNDTSYSYIMININGELSIVYKRMMFDIV